MKRGYILAYRSLFDHWAAPKNRPYTEFEALIWLLMNAAHAEHYTTHQGKRLRVPRGGLITSINELRNTFGWDWRRTNAFLARLVACRTLSSQKNGRQCRTLKLNNYETFQARKAEECRTGDISQHADGKDVSGHCRTDKHSDIAAFKPKNKNIAEPAAEPPCQKASQAQQNSDPISNGIEIIKNIRESGDHKKGEPCKPAPPITSKGVPVKHNPFSNPCLCQECKFTADQKRRQVKQAMEGCARA